MPPSYQASEDLEALLLTEASCQVRDARRAGCLTSVSGTLSYQSGLSHLWRGQT